MTIPASPARKRSPSSQTQVDDLTSALGEAYVELADVAKRGGALPPSRT